MAGQSQIGVCLVKLCDQVHSGRQQWQVLNFVCEAQRRGWTACDYTIVQNATGARKDPKHKAKYHVRNQWAFWIVLRNGPACHGAGRRLKHELVCQACGKPFWAKGARRCVLSFSPVFIGALRPP